MSIQDIHEPTPIDEARISAYEHFSQPIKLMFNYDGQCYAIGASYDFDNFGFDVCYSDGDNEKVYQADTLRDAFDFIAGRHEDDE